MGCFFFKSKSAFRQRLNFAGNVWAESTWFIPRLSLLAPRRYRCLPAPHSLGGVNSPPGQQQAGPWPYLGISAGPGNPARMDSPSSLKNRWRARTAPTSPHRKPGSTGWSTLWKKKKKKRQKSHFLSKVVQRSLHGQDRPSSRGRLLSTVGPREVFPAKGQVVGIFFSTLKRIFSEKNLAVNLFSFTRIFEVVGA